LGQRQHLGQRIGHCFRQPRVIDGDPPRQLDKSRVLVACGQGCVELSSVQPEGKRAMKGSDWAMGRGVAEGDILGVAVLPQ